MNKSFDLLRIWTVKSFKYNRIISKGKKDTSVFFAVSTIITSIVMLAFFYLLVMGIATVLNTKINDADGYGWRIVTFGGNIFLGVLAIILGGGSILAIIIDNIFSIVYQFKLNKKPIGYVALAIFVISIIIGVVFVILSI